MPHYIRRCQTANLDILHAVQYADGLLQTADLVARQVNLRDIAGNDDFRAEGVSETSSSARVWCFVLRRE